MLVWYNSSMQEKKDLRNAKIVLKIFMEQGYEAYIVGGAVRDYILHQPLTDIDITTNAKPGQTSKLFRTIPTGIKYGTVTIVFGKALEQFEVTTYRGEGKYLDSRHPETVEWINHVEDDVKRRDFTINGLLMDSEGVIHDYVGGQKDIKDHILRCIGDPVERFDEDALRILRLFYFQSKLGFDIEKNTFMAACSESYKLDSLPNERVLQEIQKIISGDYFTKAVVSLHQTGVSKHLPGLEKGIEFFSKKTDYKPFSDTFYSLCFCLNGSVPEIWKFSNTTRHKYEMVLEIFSTTNGYNALLVYQYGIDLLSLVNRVRNVLGIEPVLKNKITEIYNTMPIKTELDVRVTSDELIALAGRKPGAWLGNLKKELVKKVIIGELENEKAVLLQFSKERLGIHK